MGIFNLLFGKNKIFTEVLRKFREGEELFDLGCHYAQMGDHNSAISYFTDSIKINENVASVYLNRGASYAFQECYLLAYADYKKALDVELKYPSEPEHARQRIFEGVNDNIARIKVFVEYAEQQGNTLRTLYNSDGEEYFCKRFSEVIFQTSLSSDIALTKHFVLEEINELSELGDKALAFSINSGFNPAEYKGIEDTNETTKAFVLFKCILCCFSLDKELMLAIRLGIIKNLINLISTSQETNPTSTTQIPFDHCIRLDDAEVDIMFIVKNNNTIYINEESDHLFTIDSDGDKKLDGRIVNITFSDPSMQDVVEVFVAFDESDSYTLFTLRMMFQERLDYVCKVIYQYFSNNYPDIVFSKKVKGHSSQYIYTFKLYKKYDRYFMINNGQNQAYLIDKSGIIRDDVDIIKKEFWELGITA